jgi:hypothetical protein
MDRPADPAGHLEHQHLLGLAAMGGQARAKTHPWIPLALAAKVALDALFAAKLTLDQATKHRAFCFWCLLAASATFAQLPLVLPEARAALEHLSKQMAQQPPQ